MITDRISNLSLYEPVIPGAKAIAKAFLSSDPGAAPCEVREKSYEQKEDSKRRYEVHFHTIDLMMAREGSEVIHVCPMDRLAAAEELPGGADGMKMDGRIQGSAVLLEEGYFCAIFPGEAHMVGGKTSGYTSSVTKWVVKVPCTEAFSI